MATNLALDDALVAEALKLGGRRTKRETVTEALQEYVQRLRQQRVLDAVGTVDFDPAYDYKRQRQRK